MPREAQPWLRVALVGDVGDGGDREFETAAAIETQSAIDRYRRTISGVRAGRAQTSSGTRRSHVNVDAQHFAQMFAVDTGARDLQTRECRSWCVHTGTAS
jgi:hypothetical protein